jgi:predicted HTH domain antitoxin
MTKQVMLEVPDEVVTLWGSLKALAEDAKDLVVLEAFRRRQISAGKAAELLEISLWDFHELAARYQVPMIEMDEQDLQQELETAKRVFRRNAK